MTLSNVDYYLSEKERASINIMITLMIISLMPWFVYFYFSEYVSLGVTTVLSGVALLYSPSSFKLKGYSLYAFILILLVSVIIINGNINSYIGAIIRSLPVFVFLSAKDRIRIGALKQFDKFFFVIISISLVFWIIYLLGVPLPHSHLDRIADNQYEYDNYYVFLRHTYFLDMAFPRFSSIFLEPGYVGCFLVLLLFLDGYNFKKAKSIVYVVALFFTFSLAGWLFFFVLYIPFLYEKGKGKWLYVLFSVLIVGALLYISQSGSDNVVNAMIGKRLIVEDGSIAGYNRSTESLDYYWANNFWNSDDVLWGIRDRFELYDFSGSVDGRTFIIKNGIVAAILYLMFMLICYMNNRSRNGLWYFITCFLIVYRGMSIMLMSAFLFVFVIGLVLLRMDASPKVLQEKKRSMK